MRSIRRLARAVPVVVAAALSLASTACVSGYDCSPCPSTRCSDWDLYASVLRGEDPCANCGSPCSDWGLYQSVLRGDNPCGNCGCPTPCEPCAPPPCAPPPCAPPPCVAPAQAASGPEMPPAAKPGETWCRVEVPAKYATVLDRVQTECSSSQCIWVPPVTETHTREVCVCPPCAQEIEIPAVYRTESYCRVVCPARRETQVDACGCPHVVEIPAQTQTCTREVCIQPATRKVVYQPARYETLSETCDVQPGYWKRVEIPPVCEVVPRQVLSEPARWEWRRNPACVAPTPVDLSPCTPAPASAPKPAPAPVPEPTPAPAPVPAPESPK